MKLSLVFLLVFVAVVVFLSEGCKNDYKDLGQCMTVSFLIEHFWLIISQNLYCYSISKPSSYQKTATAKTATAKTATAKTATAKTATEATATEKTATEKTASEEIIVMLVKERATNQLISVICPF